MYDNDFLTKALFLSVDTRMNRELISKKTRNEFREFLVGWTLREIEMEFEAAGITCDRQFESQHSGARRSFVEQHYHTLDFTNSADIHKLLSAYENILSTATRKIPSQLDRKSAEHAIEGLIENLKKDGFKYKDGKITPTTPETRKIFDEVPSGRSISEVTRRNICDSIGYGWSGRLSEVDFLSRLYDLESLPSHDGRFGTAKSDIVQHREVNPGDWPDDWVFTDPRFDFIHSSDEAFLRFLCEIVHPVVRPVNKDTENLVKILNQQLAADGWEIVAKTQVSGRPVFAARRCILKDSPALGTAKSISEDLNADYVTQQITRMEAAIESDPELAIGTAKEFVETVCKTILHELGENVPGGVDLPQLVKQVREKLNLLPEDVPDEAKGAETIKRILGNLGTVAQGLAELRNYYGSGHGKHVKARGLRSRHAKLAVGAASTLAVFLFETYKERKE